MAPLGGEGGAVQGKRACQLAERGTKERTPTLMVIFCRENFILKTMMICNVTTVLNERKDLNMVVRSVPDSNSLILGWTKRPGLAALHCTVSVTDTVVERVSNARPTTWHMFTADAENVVVR